MNIRRLLPEEAERAHSLLSAAGAQLVQDGHDHWSPPAPLESVREQCSTKEVYLVGLAGRDAATWTIGSFGWHADPAWSPAARPCYLSRFAVHPDLQGRGLGKALVSLIVAAWRQRGTDAIRLDAVAQASGTRLLGGLRLDSGQQLDLDQLVRENLRSDQSGAAAAMIAYRLETPPLDDCLAVYRACSLSTRRPVADRPRMAAMFSNANLNAAAWDGELLVGVARALSDHAYCTYLSDLAVRDSHQRRGIGTALIALLRQAAPQASIILLSAPQAVDFYPRIGFSRHESAWHLRPDDILANRTSSS